MRFSVTCGKPAMLRPCKAPQRREEVDDPPRMRFSVTCGKPAMLRPCKAPQRREEVDDPPRRARKACRCCSTLLPFGLLFLSACGWCDHPFIEASVFGWELACLWWFRTNRERWRRTRQPRNVMIPDACDHHDDNPMASPSMVAVFAYPS
jgi:hypothetical protein